MDRNARNVLHQRRSSIGRRARAAQAVEFFNVLTSPQLLQTKEALLPEHRERLYPPTVTLSMFMRQVLQADGSCQKAVNGWAAQRAADGLRGCSVRTGGDCRARQRLPLEMASTLARQTGELLSQRARTQRRWRGRAVKLVDGTGVSMPETPENQSVYPQPSTQAPGVGFPLARLVVIICLATGAALDAAIGPHQGKGSGELGLVRRLLEGFRPGDVMLADALYCNYFLIAALMAKGVDVLFEQNGARITDFRRGQSRADVRAEFEELGEEFALLDEFLKARAKQRLTQAQVAEKSGTTQSAVARMESGKGKHSPSIATLSKYAEALGCRLEVKLVRPRVD